MARSSNDAGDLRRKRLKKIVAVSLACLAFSFLLWKESNVSIASTAGASSSVIVVSEPSSLSIFILGIALLGGMRSRYRKK
ncbi:hypothetical protein A9Q99_23830 [Gammaproteobacteria bacterium 45_16_T64]|nr:hypothetical protein A9Q99_23830 [Gammaproteobacteria bacterium 45_16_T64]